MDDDRKMIFLVDDNDTTLTLGKNALSGLYSVITFNSGYRMLSALEKVIPDLIILDMEMPEMSGHGVIGLLKNNSETANIPVIFLTANRDEESEIRSFDLGANDYITKPISTPRLRKRVQTCLLLESQKRELLNYNKNLEEMVEERTQSVIDLKNTLLTTIANLVEFRDHFTGSHVERTRKYIKILFDVMKIKNIYADEMAAIDEQLALHSSQLHDVGKIGIKDAILLKPGKLSSDEFTEMKKHTEFGGQIIKQIKKDSSDSDFLEYAMIYSLYHHEKWDGSGYPYGLNKYEIPLLGRVMAIADVYDALVTKRPYKDAFPHNKAVEIIVSESGVSFDPLLIDLFNEVHMDFERISSIM